MSTNGIEEVYQVGRGAADSPVILHVPHSSRHITPAARSHILLDDTALAAELDHMTDSHTGLIADRAAAGTKRAPWTFTNLASRLVVDPERFPDEREEMRAVGMGAVYTRTSHGHRLRDDDPVHEKALLATHYEPYAAAIADLVDERLAATGRAVIIDVHSYPAVALPYELHAGGERPAVCLGVDEFHTPPQLLSVAEAAFSSCGSIAVNTPFAGCYVPLKHYGTQRAVTALMVEIRRDTYMTEPGGPPTAGIDRIVEALTHLVDMV
ncbi:N-formylglutamate amidohydrolase [Planosporangium mesophilum]|uniref:N-formylglutamate amidohydrolase n=1 Tax=Planosporangium mesophilum TaxID=689768 RepID=A0A8J3TDB4_9ACTN|nr:N-formylglutamate amidohydrolase [Planosporangium mesophilum]GII22724.1 hypothetical protein Pme01_23210 [Planosporangium mesophilum]